MQWLCHDERTIDIITGTVLVVTVIIISKWMITHAYYRWLGWCRWPQRTVHHHASWFLAVGHPSATHAGLAAFIHRLVDQSTHSISLRQTKTFHIIVFLGCIPCTSIIVQYSIHSASHLCFTHQNHLSVPLLITKLTGSNPILEWLVNK